jgi:hypothetical protein
MTPKEYAKVIVEGRNEIRELFYCGSPIQNILLQVQDGKISTGRAIELIREEMDKEIKPKI